MWRGIKGWRWSLRLSLGSRIWFWGGVGEADVGPRCCEKITESGPYRRNRAHDPTNDGCQLPPKKSGVGSVWDTHIPLSLFGLASLCFALLCFAFLSSMIFLSIFCCPTYPPNIYHPAIHSFIPMILCSWVSGIAFCWCYYYSFRIARKLYIYIYIYVYI